MDVLESGFKVKEEIRIDVVNTIEETKESDWSANFPNATGLKYDVLRLFQNSGVNDLKCHYISVKSDEETVGKANVYETDMDFTSMDSSMPASIKKMVKTWHPRFLHLSMVECGLFAMNGDGLVCEEEYFDSAVSKSADYMEALATKNGQDLVVFRDVTLDRFDTYEKVLKPRGYLPCAGFTNAVIDVEWPSLEAYFESLNSKTRHKLKASIKLEEKFDIRVEVTSKFEQYSERMAELWKNVSNSSKDYSREVLSERFFFLSSQYQSSGSEVIMFFKGDKLLAFMWNLIGEQDYHMADWGVDYGYEFYREANFYRAASVISLGRAINLKKQRMQLGMTNYHPKKLLGAKMQPLTYFIKNVKSKELTSCVCRLITDAIEQPETLNYFSKSSVFNKEIDSSEYKAWLDIKARKYTSGAFSYVSDEYENDMLRLGGVSPFYPLNNQLGLSPDGNIPTGGDKYSAPHKSPAGSAKKGRLNRLFSVQPDELIRLENTVSSIFRKN